MAQGLRERLVGAWKLVSTSKNRLMDRRLSTQWERSPKASSCIRRTVTCPRKSCTPAVPSLHRATGSAAQKRRLRKRRWATSPLWSFPYGRARVHTDEHKQTLTHTMFVSLFPNWRGQTQPRLVKIEGDMLHLSTATPIISGGKETNSYLTWKRAEPTT